MYVDGVLRTEVDLDEIATSGTRSYQGPHKLNHTYITCGGTYFYLGSIYYLSDSCTPKAETGNNRRQYTMTNKKWMYNPALKFTALSPPTIAADNETEIGFMDLAPVDATLTPLDQPDTWKDKAVVGSIFFHTAGEEHCPPGSIPASGDSSNEDVYSCADAVKLGARSEGIVLKLFYAYKSAGIHGCSYDTRWGRAAFNPTTYNTDNSARVS